jgi:1,4-dihydroxy-2-naphthoate octaprenyltransferase
MFELVLEVCATVVMVEDADDVDRDERTHARSLRIVIGQKEAVTDVAVSEHAIEDNIGRYSGW